MSKKAAFFFGSGISYASFDPGAATVDGITDAAFNENWHYTTFNTFAHGKNPIPAIPDEVTLAVLEFLKLVRVRADEYITFLNKSPKPRKSHYEDLFSLAEQASQPESTFVPNLAVIDFLRRLRAEAHPVLSTFTNPVAGSDPFVTLAKISCEYLHWVVDYILRSRVKQRKGLSLIVETAKKVDTLDIFTLNHDTLVEQEFKAAGLECQTGFGDRSRGPFSIYQPGWSDVGRPRTAHTRLFKVHGSLDWYLYTIPDDKTPFRQYAVPDADPYHVRDNKGRDVMPVDWKAAFLSGTIVKEQRYGYGYWSELLWNLQEYLTHHNHVIFCGYGFGDPGVNLRLEQWARNLGDNTLVVLTPQNERDYLISKPAWLKALYAAGRVKFVPSYLETCPLSDLEKYFD